MDERAHLAGRLCPGGQDAVRGIAEAVTGHADDRAPTDTGEQAQMMRDSTDAIRLHFAEADQRSSTGWPSLWPSPFCVRCGTRGDG
ncbi:hypothetical protein ACFYOP_05830 [Streptomyces sp. NPDC006294]|uniref:hypothetical protein n=1 Tax=Streptomyces sp. NPDC006294 TaxID=3364743 RepID=UPI003686846E